jgi:antitoxin (DNA-binding transcriptional repressor) of toxin-antitoxin stability system
MYGEVMIESTAANVAEHFPEFLAKVKHGETIRIRDQGRMVARMVPDCDFMPGQQAAELFSGHRADFEAADAIAAAFRSGGGYEKENGDNGHYWREPVAHR